MSLATSGVAGAGASGAMSMSVMAHGGPSALTTHQQAQGSSSAGPPPGTTAAAPSMTGLAADQLDKNQNLTWKNIRNLAHLPLVAVDLYGDSGEVAAFPPDYTESENPIQVVELGKVFSSGTSVCFPRDSENAHKSLKRFLTKSKGLDSLLECITTSTGDSANVVTIVKPHLLLGERQIKDVHPAALNNYAIGKESSHAIEEDDSKRSGDCVTIQNGNLDGSSAKDDDFDRVTFHVNLHSSKKALTVLPEEAVKIVLGRARQLVAKTMELDSSDDSKDSFESYPPAIAVPAWACHSNAIEALMDACDGEAVLYQRSVAALVGALVPKVRVDKETGKFALEPPKLWNIIMERFKRHEEKLQEYAKKQLSKRRDDTGDDAVPNPNFMPLVLMAGMTDDGLELTAIQVKTPNPGFATSDCHCPFGDFKVLTSVSYQHSDPVTMVKKAICEISDVVDEIYPELEDDGGVATIVTYGTIAKQLQLKDALFKGLNTIKGDAVWNTTMESVSTKEEAVATGTAILGAISHTRIECETSADEEVRPAITISNIAPCAVGITYSFHGGAKNTWTEPKIVFDYDRRVPAGPYRVEFTSAECVAMRKDESLLFDIEKLVEESKKWSKGKYNSLREEAALDLRIKVVQRLERNGAWKSTGKIFSPLMQTNEVEGTNDENQNAVAIESSFIDFSLDSMGFYSTELTSDGKTIEQAFKAAKSSTFWYYAKIFFAIAFFGGFMVKSYWEERSREICVERILAFYKRAAPNSINDGDKHNAHYICWKYKGKRNKLYKKLETKYGIPVKQVYEWDDEKEEQKSEDEEVNLDDKNSEKEEL